MHDSPLTRARLSLGVSLATLVTALSAQGARAQSVGALLAATHQAASATAVAATPSAAASSSATAMAVAAANALRYQTQVNSALNLAQQAQAAARAAAAALNQNQLKGIVDGLGVGGLQPAVTALTPASSDPTGLKTWEGASLPTVAATNANAVTVTQTQQNAVLSWTTFNVGQHTTLTFQQQSNGVTQPGWVVLNRVVGVLDPTTGLPLASSVAPSQILGSIDAPGTVLVLNQNGILFGPTSQVNVGSLVATSLEIGRAFDTISGVETPRSIAERNTEFLDFGILGYSEQNTNSSAPLTNFSSQIISGTNTGNYVYDASGAVEVAAGATLTSASTGYLALLAPNVTVAGQLTASDGEVALQSGGLVTLTASTGIATSADPDVRGLVVGATTAGNASADTVTVASTGIIQSDRGYVSIGSTGIGTVNDFGVIISTTSISENGYVNLFGPTINIGADAVIAIGPDAGAGTLPQDSTSLSQFKSSRVRIGAYTPGSSSANAYTAPSTTGALIDIGANSLIYAPGATISIGQDAGATTTIANQTVPNSNITVESGATIDAAGLTNVLIPASRNSIEINPVLGNELADSPAFRNGFLNGATVFLDPRISGVTANGVAYVGSPLIAAAAYAQDVGISVSELMVKGGSVTLGVSLGSPGATLAQTGVVDVKAGAVIDISGGWKTYQGGVVQETNLVDSNGQIIPISQANPDATYIGVYNGYQVNQPRWGVTQTFGDPLLTGAHTVAQYIEGQDAGSLTLAGSTLALDGQLFAGSVAGPRQILAATPGTASPSISGDQRKLQAAPSQLPSGGFLNIVGATDVTVDGAASYVPGISTTISLNADAISDAGLSQLSITTSGRLNVNADAALSLDPGGVFSATAGRTVTVDGSITTPSGSIAISTTGGFTGSIFSSEAPAVGFTDIVVDGTLNVAGRWANDLGAADGSLVGAAYLNGGTITLTPAAQQTLYPLTGSIATPNVDLSGSILLNPSSTLNLAGGGYVSSTGQFTLTAQGGNLNLVDTTNYYDLITGAHAVGANNPVFGLADSFYASPIPIPGSITSAVVVAGTILDAGFGGGGVFSLTVPSFSLAGSPQPSLLVGCNGCGATLSARFFSQAGFATYKITSNGTDLFKTVFDSAKGAFSGILATQVVEVGAGQQLSLTQSYFSPLLDTTQSAALKSLATGSSLYSVLTPTVPVDAWDEKAVSLSLGGLLELRVDAGGQIVGAPGSALTVSELYNAGTIRLPGGTITQSETNYATTNSVGVHALSDVFGAPLADGSYSQTAANVFFLAGNTYFGASNSQVAGQELGAPAPIYILGDLNVGEAVRLVPGSVTDLSGTAVVDPRATPTATFAGSTFTDGTVVAGGSFVADGAINGAAKGFDAQTGSILNLAGSQATYDRLTLVDGPVGSTPNVAYAPSLEWSNGGNLTLNQGGTITGAAIQAQGGAPLALGGQLNVLSPVLYQNDPASPTVNAISASGVTAAGFSTFIAQNTLTSVGDVTLVLPRAVFIENAPAATGSIAPTPIIGSGGALVIDAPYIAIQSATQTVSSPVVGTIGSNTLTLNATQIDITGAALFDQSIGAATLSATGDIRLIGTTPIGAAQNTPTLVGQLAANGDLTLASAQIYPTTGTTFTLSTTGVSSPTASKGGLITFKGGSVAPSTPYSAGGSLTVLAANIVQSGVVRAPLGALTLGSNSASTIAPATASLTLAAGSTTSVSADGLDIPYGTTTDQVEWYFTPTQGAALTAPPAGVLHLAGGAISAASGATIDLKGGGDVYAYEFVAGTGGSRDVLNQLNPDPFSSNNGYQYPDGRQVYAIVPGLSSAAAAALDPLYSANYGSLYGPSQAGLTVTLSAAPGLAAGTYTLLPAQYALLPGGMRVVQDPAAGTPAVNAAGAGASVVISDGSILTPGYFGVAGANTRSSTPVVFEVQSQTIVRSESDIAQTFGNEYFTAQAASSGVPTPQLPIDAGRLILDPVTALALGAAFETTPANLAATASEPALTGRGANVDISGTALVIDDPLRPVTAATGQIVLADSDLADLGAASLFLGGTRTDGSDGTTTLHVSSNTIDVAAGATLSAPEILFAVDGKSSKITVAGGAAIEATGAAPGGSTQNYIFASGTAANGKPAPEGGFLRVSDGPQRLLTRPVGATVGSIVIGGGPQRATLSGASIALNSPATLTIAANTRILDATAIALAARSITVGQSGAGLVITPALQTLLSNTPSVTLAGRTGIGFAAGSYAFQTLTLDTPALTAIGSGAVAINVSSDLSIGSTSALTRACGGAGAFACGTGSFAITAKEIAFQSGTIRTYGSGGGVTLIAPMGTFADGSATLNVGAAPLTIDTPFIGDRGTGLAGAVQPSLTLTTTGSASFDSATPASAFTAPAGTPGSTLAINAASVSIVGTELRATAGTLTVTSASGIAISGGALLASPSYAKTFGDSADSTTVSAPGGTLSLVATTGDIAISDDSTLAVGGTQGQSGLISISAQNGSAYAYHGSTSDVVGLAAVLSAQGGGGSLTLNSNGAFDLTAFAAGSGQQFTGAIDVHTGTGDLTLAAGDVLTATSVTLTADGGQIDQAGKIDTSGSSGGDVSLYGETGVDLASTAVIDSRATGFGATSTQQAAGGNVILGVDGAGALAVDAGAVIDVSAVNTGNRLVNMNRTNGTYYTFVAGDVGGTLTLRAPVINPGGLETMNVSFGGAVDGASSVLLDGFRRFRLAGIASTPGYVGVSISGDTATLDLTATAPRSANALSSTNGFVVQFVQNFDVSSIYGALGGLASAPNFHARPEVELDYLGNIVLASNWNLGAGVVNVSGAVAAGLMAADPGLPGQYYVVGANAQALATNEGLILADYTRATYHVGGSFAAEPGILTIRAGRDLTLNGSITDGFFQFADQTDPNYLDQVLGGGNRTYQANLAPTTDGTSVTINFPGKTGLLDPGFNAATGATGVSAVGAYVLPSAPYSAAANSAAALGDQPVAGGALVTGTGDPLGSAQLFPLLPSPDGGSTAIASWSYRLVSGAALFAPGSTSTFQPSANPLDIVTGAKGNIVVQGQNVYGYQAVIGAGSFGPDLDLLDSNQASLAPSAWLSAYETQNGLTDSAPTTISFTLSSVRDEIDALETQFAAMNPTDTITVSKNGSITTSLSTAAQFLNYIDSSNSFSQIAANYSAPSEAGISAPIVYATAPTRVRTGTGSISMVASGTIDLRNGDQTLGRRTGLPTEVPLTLTSGGKLVAAGAKALHLGGAAVYTAGATANLGVVSATDVATGAVYSVDLAANAVSSDNLADQTKVIADINGNPRVVAGAYTYGGGTSLGVLAVRSGFAGILIADPVYSDGGGDVTLKAGLDVLSRRDTVLENELGGFGTPSTNLSAFTGVGDQPWRTGILGGNGGAVGLVNLLTDPQLFAEGVGTLGGGNITIDAGRTVSDLSTVASDSITTADRGRSGRGRPAPGAREPELRQRLDLRRWFCSGRAPRCRGWRCDAEIRRFDYNRGTGRRWPGRGFDTQ